MPAPLLNPGMVAVAKSEPVGTSPLVARIETVTFGLAPLQPEQNIARSTEFSWPVTCGWNVCAAQVTFENPKPLLLMLLFCSLGFPRITSPGLVFKSTLNGVPALKSAFEVSVKQPRSGPRTKFWFVIEAWFTTRLLTVTVV